MWTVASFKRYKLAADLCATTLRNTIRKVAVAWYRLCCGVLAGTLPSSWSADTKLQSIIVALNQLTGTLPSSWSQLSNLVNLDVRSNTLSGPVPDSWRGSAAPGVLPTSGMTSLTTL